MKTGNAAASQHDHLVLFYESDDFLVDGVCAFLVPALLNGDAAIVAATAAHRVAFEAALLCAGVDVDAGATAFKRICERYTSVIPGESSRAIARLRQGPTSPTHDREMLRRSESVINAAGDGIFGINAQGRIAIANPAAADMIGYARREAERSKDQFTAIVSHELRTPLTSIRASLGLLESGALGPLPERGRRMVQIALKDTDRLVRLIDDILDLARIESGSVRLHRVPCDAADLTASAIDAVSPMATEAGRAHLGAQHARAGSTVAFFIPAKREHDPGSRPATRPAPAPSTPACDRAPLVA